LTVIRKATSSDVPLLLPLIAEYWKLEDISGFETGRVEIALTRLLSEPGLGAGWLAIFEGVAVGYLLAVYVFSLEHQGLTAEIDELFVSQLRRNQGVGGALLRSAESEFVKVGCKNVSLQLSRENDSARVFYRRHLYSERAGYEILDKMLSGTQVRI
jgi:GNAT superfamily N-acetyltransferase